MFALISPNEQATVGGGIGQGPLQVVGQRVADVAINPFPVAEPLFWIPCADTVTADSYYYDSADRTIKAKV